MEIEGIFSWFWKPATIVVVVIAMGCGGELGGSGQCGGAADSGACVRIESIQPTYLGQTPVSDVDVVQDACFDAMGVFTGPEPFTDHNAILRISNSPFPGADPSTNPGVTLLNYSISYTVNRCPDPTVNFCPPLETVSIPPGQTTYILPGDFVDVPLKFVDLATKFEYINDLGRDDIYPSYSAHYTITGTDDFGSPISIQGSAEFTIGNYDYCP